MDLLLNQEFKTIEEAYNKIKTIIITAGLSYKKHKLNQRQYTLICKEPYLYLPITRSYLKRPGIIRIIVYIPYNCSFTTYSNFPPSNSITYTLLYYIRSIIQDCIIRPKHIANQEQLQHSNQLLYKQA